MAQKGISRVTLRIRSRVSVRYCSSVVRAPKTCDTCGRRTVTSERIGRGSSASCSRAFAARLPWERAVSTSTDIGNSAQTPTSAATPTPVQSNRL